MAFDATTHQAAADCPVLEAIGTMLGRVAAPANLSHLALPDPTVRVMAIGTLDALLVLN